MTLGAHLLYYKFSPRISYSDNLFFNIKMIWACIQRRSNKSLTIFVISFSFYPVLKPVENSMILLWKARGIGNSCFRKLGNGKGLISGK